MRLLAVLLAALLFSHARAADLLVLISNEQALPQLNLDRGEPSDPLSQAEWVLWPRTGDNGSGNRILSVLSGLNWRGEPLDDSFALQRGSWRNRGYDSLTRRGYFRARRRQIGAINVALVLGPRGTTSNEALMLALGEKSSAISGHPFSAAPPRDGLLVYAASGNQDWSGIRELGRRAGGRTVVLEYPPSQGAGAGAAGGWGRYWLFRGYKQGRTPVVGGIGLPGLVRATDLADLLLRPERMRWIDSPLEATSEPNQWLSFIRNDGLWLLAAWALFAACAMTWASILVMTEHRSSWLPVVIDCILLFPAAAVGAGVLSGRFGLGAWPVWLALAGSIVLHASFGLRLALRRTRAHPMAAVAVIGLLTLLFAGSAPSLLSGSLQTYPSDVSPEALGAFFGYLAASFAFLHGAVPPWVGRAFAVVLTGFAFVPNVWWAAGHPSFVLLPAIACVAGEGRLSLPLLALIAVLPSSVMRPVHHGFAWAPAGLVDRAGDEKAVNVAEHVQFLVSPILFMTCCVVGGVTLFGSRFFTYRAKRIIALDTRREALFLASLACFALGLLEPVMLHAGLLVGLGGLAVLLRDGVAGSR